MFHFLLDFFRLYAVLVLSITPFHSPHHTPNPHPTPIITATPTVEPSLTPTTLPTVTPVPTLTTTPTPTATPTPLITVTVMPSLTPTLTTIPTVLPTASPTATLIPTAIPSPIPSPVVQPTVILTATPTASLTPELSLTPTASPTPEFTITPTAFPLPTEVLSPTTMPSPTQTPTEIPSPTPTITKIGNDISYPQCGKTLPTGQGFGIVGVNGGIATTTNPCLSTQLLWAKQSLGTANQSPIQLYVNTGNPGGLNTQSWPSNNIDPSGTMAPNPYGLCDRSDSLACAWQYGWNRAVDDVLNKFILAAQTAGISTEPSTYPWWLDVETANSWKYNSDFAHQSNRAVLEAMVSYLQSRGITVGIYSTNYQWNLIVGPVPSGSNLNGLRNWRPGATDLTMAQSYCSLTPLTSGGSVIMTQFVMNNLDYDFSCI